MMLLLDDDDDVMFEAKFLAIDKQFRCRVVVVAVVVEAAPLTHIIMTIISK